MSKLIHSMDRDSKDREERTKAVIKKSVEARSASRAAVIDAYVKAGKVYALRERGL